MKPITNQLVRQLLLCAGLLSCVLVLLQAQPASKANRRVTKLEQQQTSPETAPATTTTEPIEPPARLGLAARLGQARQPNRALELGKVPSPMLDRLLLQLELKDEQKLLLQPVRRKYNLEIQRLLRLVKAKQDVFDDAMNAAEFNPDDIERKADDLAKTQGELLRTQTRQMIEIRKILTPEQFVKFHDLLQEERRKTLQQRLP